MLFRARGCFVSLVSLLALSATCVQAHTTHNPIIAHSENVVSVHHEILPRVAPHELHQDQSLAKRALLEARLSDTSIHHDDTLRLQLEAYNATYYLYLEPNHDLFHANLNFGDDMSREDIRAFKGVVLASKRDADLHWNRIRTTSRQPDQSGRTLDYMMHEEGVVGWARMIVDQDEQDRNKLILSGAFTVFDDTFHVTPKQTYHRQKRSEDALPLSYSPESHLVIFRDSDLYRPGNSHLRTKRSARDPTNTCGSDTMLNRTTEFEEALSQRGHYYPPDRNVPLPMGAMDSDLSSSWPSLLKPASLQKRKLEIRAAGPNPVPAGCPQNRMVIYMGVAADCAYVRNYGNTTEARKQIFSSFNTASAIYESTFNVALGIITLNIESSVCPTTPTADVPWNQDCSEAYTIDRRLSDFSWWRGQGDRSKDGAGLWHLMTKCNSGAVVGIAWTKTVCQMKTQQQNGNQYTAGTGVSSASPNEWMIVAHEIGHGFGAIHDCTATCSPDCCRLSTTVCDAGGKYIMNPSENQPTREFSPCSIKAICSTIQSPQGQCLQPPGTREVQESGVNICGNGIRETGEECDCGSPEDCAKDTCCDGATCKFKNGAVCDDINDDCCRNCQPAAAGTVCRNAISECDTAEVCSGTSATCPPDVRIPDLTPCGNGTTGSGSLQCAKGVCTSRDLQCQQQGRGITAACPNSNTCDLLCNDPGGNAMTCTQLGGLYFLDGTPCGFGGTCQQGACSYSSGINGVLDWARRHLYIVIPVGIVVGLLVLCCIWSCICSPLIRRSRGDKPKSLRKRYGRQNRLVPAYPGPAGAAAAGHLTPNPNGIPPPGTYDPNSQYPGVPVYHAPPGVPPPMPAPPPPSFPSHPPPVYQGGPPPVSQSEADLQRVMDESRREYEMQNLQHQPPHSPPHPASATLTAPYSPPHSPPQSTHGSVSHPSPPQPPAQLPKTHP
ncbi:hypothetical protein DFQ26_002636 [Actinomortierella ambigua]|nr:hypothetical protein DFQ26_002636 [Actinomortierella ambigua]